MMDTRHLRRLMIVAISTPMMGALAACGGGDTATSDSASGTVATGDSGTMNAAAPNNAGMMDGSMASLLATVNHSEIAAGQLASTKARNAEVKSYAQMMVTEHTAGMQQLQQLATASGWSLPDSMGNMSVSSSPNAAGGSNTAISAGASTAAGTASGTASGTGGGTGTMANTPTQGGDQLSAAVQQMHQMQMQTMAQLRGKSGADFDRDYMDSQIAAHQQTLDLLRQYSTNVQNNELRTHVQGVQDKVQQHLQQAQDIRQKLGGTTTGGTQ